jgi:D-aminopeptidase
MGGQLIVIADMEGTSGIFERNREALFHGWDLWRTYGRKCVTSDVLAVCDAAVACGIEEIYLYDGHYAGDPEFNVELEKLPPQVKVFDTPDRCFLWRRIRGQAAQEPFGLITVAQHARYGEPDAYFPHTIQSPPIHSFWVNGKHIAEIGLGAYNFCGTRYLANIGCAASHKEAKEICSTVSCISVKDKKNVWEPTPEETYPLIREGVIRAINEADSKERIALDGPFHFALRTTDGYRFDCPESFPWAGAFSPREATWTAPDVEIGLELFNYVRQHIVRES